MIFDQNYFFGITVEQIYYLSVMLLSLITLVLIFGIIWRTEKMLDTSFKFLAIAFIFFVAGEFYKTLLVIEVVSGDDLSKYAKAGFLIFFTLAILEIRKMILKVGEEKKNRK